MHALSLMLTSKLSNPQESTACTSAPAAIKASTTRACPVIDANIKAVSPPEAKHSTSAPPSIKALTTHACPFIDAIIKTVMPVEFTSCTLAPHAIKASTTHACPFHDANIKAVQPSESTACTSNPQPLHRPQMQSKHQSHMHAQPGPRRNQSLNHKSMPIQGCKHQSCPTLPQSKPPPQEHAHHVTLTLKL
uniref:Uncharacterized protein n=1 Tax=Eutreptiella gymnastica TaxID=73025 RepID=A0A7S4LGL7_9EUGL